MVDNIRKYFVRLLPGTSFARGVSVLAGGTISAQLIVLLAAPILTRLYSPDDFGVLAVYIGILSLLSVIATLKYELAIPLPEDESEVVALTLLSFLILLIIVGLSVALVLFFGDNLADLLQISSFSDYLWLIPLGIFLAGAYQVFTYWAVRLKQFPVLAKTKIWQQVATAAVQIFSFKAGGIGLVWGQVSGQGVGVYTLAKHAVSRESWKGLPFSRIKFVAWRYRNFPVFSTWAGFLNTAGTQVPPILIASVFGVSSAGFYALAHRLIALPMTVVGQAVGQVFFSNAPADYRSGELASLLVSAHRVLIKIILPPVIFLILFGPVSFGLIFGPDWRVAGEVASWLALWMLVSFSTSPLSFIFAVVEKQHLGMLMQALLFVLRLSGIGIGAYYGDFMLGVICYSICNVVGYILYQIISFHVVGLKVSTVFLGFTVAAPLIVLSLIIKEMVLFENYNIQALIFIIFIVFSIFYMRKVYIDYIN